MFRRLGAADNADFFRDRVTRSPWFWLDVFGLAVVAYLGVSSGLSHPKTFAREWPLWTVACTAAVLTLLWAVNAHHRVREMNIDWGTVEPNTPLYMVLDLLADDIRAAPVAVITMAVAIVGFL
jgi:hypothetical protein